MIFTEEQRKQSVTIQDSEYSKLSSLESFEVKDLAILWSYYSGKIEGNTYSFVETEVFLTTGITAPHRLSDALMLKNLYNTFISELESIKRDGRQTEVNKALLMRLHSQLTSGILQNQDRGVIRDRAVRITGTEYTPLVGATILESKLEEILARQYEFSDPIERAVFLHCNIAKLQPFLDGNKRTSRLVESITLMNANLIPIYSNKDSDFVEYKKALILFYEEGDYSAYSDYMLTHQLERVQKLERLNSNDIIAEAEQKLGKDWRRDTPADEEPLHSKRLRR